MSQVIKFFGWLLFGVGITLFVFGHLSMAFVYNMAYVMESMWPSDDAMSSIWTLPIAMAPGLALLGLGRLMERFGSDEDEDADGADGSERTPTPPLNPPSHSQN